MNDQPKETPSVEELETELRRVRYRHRYNAVLRSTIYILITVAAAAILVATLWLPMLQVYGSSMAPTISDGQTVLSVKTNRLEQGDIIALYHNNKILVRRVIAMPGDWVSISDTGAVTVNGILLEEPYVAEPTQGQLNIELPCQVPEGRYFVMGDNRAASVDSTNTALGCIEMEQVLGKILLRIWPLEELSVIK